MVDPSGPRQPESASGTLICAYDAAPILGCTERVLDHWRRTVLPGLYGRETGQADNEFRDDEIVAIAVGMWLKEVGWRDAEGFAARLVDEMPDGDDWGVVKRGYATVEVFEGRLQVDFRRGRRVSHRVFDATPVFAAIRAARPGPVPPAAVGGSGT